jgi:hypothetical protein
VFHDKDYAPEIRPCACGCGKLVEGGLMSVAHPELYRGELG